MRPLRLELAGFTAFREPTCIDFAGLDLFAVTGPTGAGKSSLVDAICYALYGRVPRVSNEVGSCISPGHERLWVDLDFQAGDYQYRIHREMRRRGPPNVRLEVCIDGRWEPLEQGAQSVTARIERIVGLSYEGFTRSVLLPQGQFAEFLAGSPEKRRDVLHSLLRLDLYEHMRRRAGEQAADLGREIDVRQRALTDQYADATLANLEARQQELERKRTEVTALQTELSALEALAAAVARLEQALGETSRLEAERDRAQAGLAAAKAVLDEGDSARQKAAAALADVRRELAQSSYDSQLAIALTRATAMAFEMEREAARLEEARRDTAEFVRGLEAATAGAQAAKAALSEATALRETAEGAHDEARRHDLAAALQSGLQPGDECPVCGGRVGALSARPAPDLAEAVRRHDAARAAEREAAEADGRASTAVAVAGARLDTARATEATLSASVERRRAELAGVLPGMTERSHAALRLALDTQEQARRERERLDAEVGRLDGNLRGLEDGLTQARNSVAELQGRAAQLQAALDAAAVALQAARSETGRALVAGDWPGWQRAFDNGQPLRGPVDERRVAGRTAHGDALMALGFLEGEVERLRRDIETASSLREEVKSLRTKHDIAADLAEMLRANRFQAYVQAEALRLLAADGSAKLQQLSSGRYTLAVSDNGQDFVVMDEWNAGDKRSVRTLSGGETFLASLALSLALAESLQSLAPGQRVVLDSVFLDEGFGSLDQEALRLAADALDSLRDGVRMVCVITHLPELAERLPARIEVTKSEKGSTVTVK